MSTTSSKNTRFSPAEIIEYVVEYRKIVKELDGLKKEIQQLRHRLKPRMTKLLQDKEKFETIILQHLEKQQDPGLKFQDTIIYKEPRKFIQPKKEKDDKLTQLLLSYNVNDPNLVKEVTDLMRSKKIIDQSRFILKMKSL
jgi:hypothetical protein